tara:strand:+ start:1534 stop:1683 length:150 start_codon:yes stop_codon:yes gene_type:complete
MSAFGTQFVPEMALTTFDGQQWSDPSLVPSNSIAITPRRTRIALRKHMF